MAKKKKGSRLSTMYWIVIAFVAGAAAMYAATALGMTGFLPGL